MTNLQDRLKLFLNEIQITMQSFEQQCGIGQGVGARLSEKSYATTFRRIENAFPQLNINWLKTGEGSMLNTVPVIDMSRKNSDGDNDVYGDIIKIGDLRLVSEKDAEICQLKKEITLLRELLVERERVIDEKNERIAELKERISELKGL